MISAAEREIIERAIHRELCAGISKHGMWDDYEYLDMFETIVGKDGELREAMDALHRGDHHGEHGTFRELAQSAACIQKMMMQILRRERITHIHTSYPWHCGGDTGTQTTNEGHVNCPRCLAGRGE